MTASRSGVNVLARLKMSPSQTSGSVSQMKSAAPTAASDGPKRCAQYAAPIAASSSTSGYLKPIFALQLEQRPLRKAKLRSGTFSAAVIGLAQEGQRERGVKRLKGSAGGSGLPPSSAHSARHSSSIILGSR